MTCSASWSVSRCVPISPPRLDAEAGIGATGGDVPADGLQPTPLECLDRSRALSYDDGDLVDGQVAKDAEHQDVPLVRRKLLEQRPRLGTGSTVQDRGLGAGGRPRVGLLRPGEGHAAPG